MSILNNIVHKECTAHYSLYHLFLFLLLFFFSLNTNLLIFFDLISFKRICPFLDNSLIHVV